jgi:hypothetical protein
VLLVFIIIGSIGTVIDTVEIMSKFGLSYWIYFYINKIFNTFAGIFGHMFGVDCILLSNISLFLEFSFFLIFFHDIKCVSL